MMRIRNRPLLSWPKKLLFALFTTIIALVIVEGGLRLVGIQPVTDTRDPFVGFSEQMPLMELVRDEAGREWLRTARSKLIWFNDQAFAKQKATGTKRVFCLGGSTTFGHPYDDTTSFSGWMREFLPVAERFHDWEVINCGGISYASYRVAAIMEELVQYEPDLFVVFSAHNEFLERRTYSDLFARSAASLKIHAALAQTRSYALADRLFSKRVANPLNTLPGEVDEMLNHSIGPVDYHRDLTWRKQVVDHYELNLRRMIAIARRANCEIVLVTPASNERNCSPFKSEFAESRGEDQRAEALKAIATSKRSERSENSSDLESGIEALKSAKLMAPEFAETRYRLARLLMKAGRDEEASDEFIAALNEDVCPLRAVDEISAALRRVGTELEVPVVDFEELLRAECEREYGHRSLGEEYFLDHVHPTIEVNRKLALWIIESLQSHGIVEGDRLSEPEWQSEVAAAGERVLGRIDQRAHGVALRNLAKVLHWSGKFAEAAPRAVDALELLVDDAESRYVLADCLHQMGDDDRALAQYELLFDGPQDWGKAYLPYAELLVERGEFAKAKPFLLLAILHDPKNAYTHFLLGRTHLELGELAFAEDSLNESNRLAPNEPATLALREAVREKAVQSER